VPGDTVFASQRAGDFVLPSLRTKIGMIAGGIGVTPFVAHVLCMRDTSQWRDTVLIYCNNTFGDLAYSAVWDEATRAGLFRMVPVYAKESPGEGYEIGYLTADCIVRQTPDYRDRIWYISGPPAMVASSKKILRQLGVSRRNIKEDFFPGIG
jgi:glycine betaine catabolism B